MKPPLKMPKWWGLMNTSMSSPSPPQGQTSTLQVTPDLALCCLFVPIIIINCDSPWSTLLSPVSHSGEFSKWVVGGWAAGGSPAGAAAGAGRGQTWRAKSLPGQVSAAYLQVKFSYLQVNCWSWIVGHLAGIRNLENWLLVRNNDAHLVSIVMSEHVIIVPRAEQYSGKNSADSIGSSQSFS